MASDGGEEGGPFPEESNNESNDGNLVALGGEEATPENKREPRGSLKREFRPYRSSRQGQ